MKKTRCSFYLIALLSVCFFSTSPGRADDDIALSNGQTIYVPAYSHIYSGDRKRPFLLTVTASIRNTDPTHPIEITRVDYYDTQGTLIKKYLETPLWLKPLAASSHIVPESDKTGGSGASFMVEWKADKRVNPPIVESVMIGTQSQQGISFTSRGQVIMPGK